MSKRYICDHADDPQCPQEDCQHHRPHKWNHLCNIAGACWLDEQGAKTLDAQCVPVEEKE